MSRRKQTTPRHLDSDGDLTGLLDNENHPEPAVPAATSQSEGGDAHVCGKCRAEFLGLTEFIAHKKTCTRKRVVVMYDEDGKETVDPNDPDGPPPLKQMANGDFNVLENRLTEEGEEECDAPTLENEITPFESVEDCEENSISQQGFNMESGEEDNIGEEVDEEDEEEEDEEGMELCGPDSIEKSSQVEGNPNPLAPIIPPLGGISFLPDSNVKLEALDSTKVAVAQFAENNISPSDLAILQSTLYSLQQQQLMQLHLLQQLQAQLMAGITPSLATLQAMLPPGSQPLPASLVNSLMQGAQKKNNNPKTDMIKPDAIKDSPAIVAPPTTSTPPVLSPQENASDKIKLPPLNETSKEEEHISTSLVPPSPDCSTPVADTKLLFQKVENLLPKTQPFLGVDLGKPPNVTASNLDRSQYCADDPFFKHKCRFCHKVFGSDSALQIHIRSHTVGRGMVANPLPPSRTLDRNVDSERPFKCNICGNRFSTKGNLKVHFQRHKAKYPHVKMNPNPVPEHLDRPNNAPILVAPIPMMQNKPEKTTSGPVIPPPALSSKPEEKPLPATTIVSTPSEPLPTPPAVPVKSSSPGPSNTSSEPSPSQPTVGEPALIRAPSTGSSAPSISSAPSTPGVTKESPITGPPPVSIGMPPFSTNIMPPALSNPLLSMGGPMMPAPHLPLHPGLHPPGPRGIHPMGMEPPFFRPSILPSKQEDPMEQYMEIDKSETSKLQALVENIETKLTDPNQCAICHRILSCKSALQMHYRTHTGERPFKCKICGRAFTTKGNLKTHMGVHRAKPPMRMMHQCPVCHKQFTNSLVLQQHIRMHTGELPKDMPMPPELLPPPGFMPFPSFPFMPPMGFLPGMPPPGAPGAPGALAGGELDLRKPVEKKPDDLRGIKMEKESESDAQSQKDEEADEKASIDDNPDDLVRQARESDYDSDQDSDQELDEALAQDMENSPYGRDDPPNLLSEMIGTPLSDEKARDCSSVSSAPDANKPDGPMMSPYQPPKLPENPFRNDYLFCPSSVITSSVNSSSYSTSLMALEERVKAIDTTSPLSQYSQRPLEGMANILKRTETQMSPNGSLQNGLQSPHTSPAMGTPEQVADNRTSPGSNRDDSRSSNGASPSANSDSNASFENRLEGLDGMLPFRGLGALDLSPKPFEMGKPHTTCNVCFKTFACKSALDIHYRSHTKERPFKCEVCDRGFTTKGNMKQHMLTHKIRDLPNGSNQSGSQSGEESNSPQSDEQPRLQPSIPLGPMSSPLPLPPSDILGQSPPSQNHIEEKKTLLVPPTTPLKPMVPSTTPNKPVLPPSTPDKNVNPILQPMTSLKSMVPPISTPKPLVASNIQNKPPMQPTTPNKSFPPNSGSNTTPGDSSPFVKRQNPRHMCTVCTKPFSSASALQIHMRTHTGDKPFKCTVCGKAFTTKGNLKVHMGTHMWNNSPSRRGRRMSVDTLPPGFPSPKDAEFFNNFAPRPPPEMFPFPPFPGFHNGFPPKMNEISVIQSINGNMVHPPPPVSSTAGLIAGHLPPGIVDSMMKVRPPVPMLPPAGQPPTSSRPPSRPPSCSPSEPSIKMDTTSPVNDINKVKLENNNNNPTSTSSHISSGGSGELDLSMRKSPGLTSPPRSEPPTHNLAWVWKTTCHLCDKVCSSVSALELHMKGHMTRPEETSPKPLMT